MISVIIPSHNNNSTLSLAVRSALGQTYKDIEVIIIDNGSENGADKVISPEILEDRRVHLIKYSSALGAAGARNAGLREAKGEYIAFLDADDIWKKNKLELELRVMEKCRNAVIVFSGRGIIDEKGRYTGRYIGCDRKVDYKSLLRTNQINCSSVLVRRETLREGFPYGKMHEDYALWLTILKRGGYAFGINRPLILYRKRKQSESSNKLASALKQYRVYKYIGIGKIELVINMISYAVAGIKKHYL